MPALNFLRYPAALAKTPSSPSPRPLPRELHVKILEKGTGPTVTAGRELEANYHGQIWDGEVFDSSFQRGVPATFPIGVGAVIAGWDRSRREECGFAPAHLDSAREGIRPGWPACSWHRRHRYAGVRG